MECKNCGTPISQAVVTTTTRKIKAALEDQGLMIAEVIAGVKRLTPLCQKCAEDWAAQNKRKPPKR